ncbi:hypothetical protein GIS00_18320 [Nakamurella sp. YIM 132087]|uniref:TerD domain-containing protein n=1 Tax=Nakamurella alba TaxID=2665158 RepID=A0A7K1FST5_9ACTN|nr:TerD family protein [Nakamurella alba]MTD15894.1 hypothetical protein [Nakamurella alba]
MTELSRGANAPVSGPTLELSVAGARQGSVDLMVFQLGADRKVRSDADFVFFNQPTSPEGAVRLTGADRVQVDLGAVPPAVETLAVAVSLDDAVAGGLRDIGGLGVTVGGPADAHSAPASGLTSERAAVLVEIYRRQGSWKVRNVSAGWTAGLPALAREHGVSVDDAPAPASPPVAAAPSAGQYPPPQPAPSAQPAPSNQPSQAPWRQNTGAQPYPPQQQPQQPYPAGQQYPPQQQYPAAQHSPNPQLPPPVLPQNGAPHGVQPPQGPPPGYAAPGGFPLPGGGMPSTGSPPPASGPGGWPPPGGDLQPVPLPPPPGMVAGYPPPGGR